MTTDTTAPDWRSSLPEDLQKHDSLRDIKDVGALAKSFVETKALVGASVRLPGPDAAPEAKVAFLGRLRERFPNLVSLPDDETERAAVEPLLWKALGKPSDPKGYTLEGIEGLEGASLEDLAKTAHGLGLTKAQFKQFAQGVAQAQADRAKGLKLGQDTLRREWGLAYEERVAGIVDTAKKLGAPESTLRALSNGELSPEHMKVWASIAKGLNGGTAPVAGQGPGASGRLDPSEAAMQIEEIRANPAYFDDRKNPALHAALTAKMQKLMAQAYPEDNRPASTSSVKVP